MKAELRTITEGEHPPDLPPGQTAQNAHYEYADFQARALLEKRVRWPGAPPRRTSAWPCPGG